MQDSVAKKLEEGVLTLEPPFRQAITEKENEDTSGFQAPRALEPPGDLADPLPFSDQDDQVLPLQTAPKSSSGDLEETESISRAHSIILDNQDSPDETTPSRLSEERLSSIASCLETSVFRLMSQLISDSDILDLTDEMIRSSVERLSSVATHLDDILSKVTLQLATPDTPPVILEGYVSRYHDYTSDLPSSQNTFDIIEGQVFYLSSLKSTNVVKTSHFVNIGREIVNIPDTLTWEDISSRTKSGKIYLDLYENAAPDLHIFIRVATLVVLRGGVMACGAVGAAYGNKMWVTLFCVLVALLLGDVYDALLNTPFAPGKTWHFFSKSAYHKYMYYSRR